MSDIIQLSLSMKIAEATGKIDEFTSKLTKAAQAWDTVLEKAKKNIQDSLNEIAEKFDKTGKKEFKLAVSNIDVSDDVIKKSLDDIKIKLKKESDKLQINIGTQISDIDLTSLEDISSSIGDLAEAFQFKVAIEQLQTIDNLLDSVTSSIQNIGVSISDVRDKLNELTVPDISFEPLDVVLRVADVRASQEYSPSGIGHSIANIKVPSALKVTYIYGSGDYQSAKAAIKIPSELLVTNVSGINDIQIVGELIDVQAGHVRTWAELSRKISDKLTIIPKLHDLRGIENIKQKLQELHNMSNIKPTVSALVSGFIPAWSDDDISKLSREISDSLTIIPKLSDLEGIENVKQKLRDLQNMVDIKLSVSALVSGLIPAWSVDDINKLSREIELVGSINTLKITPSSIPSVSGVIGVIDELMKGWSEDEIRRVSKLILLTGYVTKLEKKWKSYPVPDGMTVGITELIPEWKDVPTPKLTGLVTHLDIANEIKEIKYTIKNLEIQKTALNQVANQLKDKLSEVKVKVSELSVYVKVIGKLSKFISEKLKINITDVNIAAEALKNIETELKSVIGEVLSKIPVNILISTPSKERSKVDVVANVVDWDLTSAPELSVVAKVAGTEFERVKTTQEAVEDITAAANATVDDVKSSIGKISDSFKSLDVGDIEFGDKLHYLIESIEKSEAMFDDSIRSVDKNFQSMSESLVRFARGTLTKLIPGVSTFFGRISDMLKFGVEDVKPFGFDKLQNELSKIGNQLSGEAKGVIDNVLDTISTVGKYAENIIKSHKPEDIVSGYVNMMRGLEDSAEMLARNAPMFPTEEMKKVQDIFAVMHTDLTDFLKIEKEIVQIPEVKDRLQKASDLFMGAGLELEETLIGLEQTLSEVSANIRRSGKDFQELSVEVPAIGKNFEFAIPADVDIDVIPNLITALSSLTISAQRGIKDLKGFEYIREEAQKLKNAIQNVNLREFSGDIERVRNALSLFSEGTQRLLTEDQRKIGNILFREVKKVGSSFSRLVKVTRLLISSFAVYNAAMLATSRETKAAGLAQVGGVYGQRREAWWDRLREMAAKGFAEEDIVAALQVAATQKLFAAGKEGYETMVAWTDMVGKATRAWTGFGATTESVATMFGTVMRLAGFNLEDMRKSLDGITLAMQRGRMTFEDALVALDRFSGRLAILKSMRVDISKVAVSIMDATSLLTRMGMEAEEASTWLSGLMRITDVSQYGGAFAVMGKDLVKIQDMLREGKLVDAVDALMKGLREKISPDIAFRMQDIFANMLGMTQDAFGKLYASAKVWNDETKKQYSDQISAMKQVKDYISGAFSRAYTEMEGTATVAAKEVWGELKNVADMVATALIPVFKALAPHLKSVIFGLAGIAKVIINLMDAAPIILGITAALMGFSRAAALAAAMGATMQTALKAGLVGLAAGVAAVAGITLWIKSEISDMQADLEKMPKMPKMGKITSRTPTFFEQNRPETYTYEEGYGGQKGGVGFVNKPTVIGEAGTEFAMVVPRREMTAMPNISDLSSLFHKENIVDYTDKLIDINTQILGVLKDDISPDIKESLKYQKSKISQRQVISIENISVELSNKEDIRIMANAVSELSGILNGLQGYLLAFSRTVQNISQPIMHMGGVIDTVAEMLRDFPTLEIPEASLSKVISKFVDAISGVLKSINKPIADMRDAIIQFATTMQKLPKLEISKSSISEIVSEFVRAISGVLKSINQPIGGMKDAISRFTVAIQKFPKLEISDASISNIVSKFTKAVSSTVQSINQPVVDMKDVIGKLTNMIKEFPELKISDASISNIVSKFTKAITNALRATEIKPKTKIPPIKETEKSNKPILPNKQQQKTQESSEQSEAPNSLLVTNRRLVNLLEFILEELKTIRNNTSNISRNTKSALQTGTFR